MRRVLVPALIAATKLALSLAVLSTGFRAISDDDYSRVTIAQEFARHPRLDPSGTSWLPLPFWVYGSAMKAFGVSLDTAQVLAVVLGVAGTVAVWSLARLGGLSPRAALVASLIGACIPHAAHYGAAMVPDYPTAVLVLAAAVSLLSQKGGVRVLGACCAGAATLSRYETWPVALVVCAYAALDWSRRAADRRWLLGTAILAPLGPTAWIVHGMVRHHDAFFFLKRVAAYRRALGDHGLPLSERLLKQPLALFTGEPELALAVVLLVLAAWLRHGRAGLRGRGWFRPALALLGLVACLMVGDWLDGVPTHHEDRVLLSLWLGLALIVGELADRVATPTLSVGELADRVATPTLSGATNNADTPDSARGSEPSFAEVRAGTERGSKRRGWERRGWKGRAHPCLGPVALGVVMAAAALAAWKVRPLVVKDEPFSDRSHEVAVGRAAAQAVPRGERLAVYTTDYGYFAVQAAFARPVESAPLSHHDPRRSEVDPLSSPDALAQRLDAMGARYLVVPAPHQPKAAGFDQLPSDTTRFSLLRR